MPAENLLVKLLATLVLAVAASASTGLKAVHYGQAPPDFSVPTTKGAEQLSQLRGKPIVINFWSSWCPPCVDELPSIARLKQTYGDRIRIITIDWDEDPGVGESFLQAHHLDLPVIDDFQSRIYKAYSLSEVPDTVVLNAAGDVTSVTEGELSWTELNGFVEQALAE